ncbi:MAG: hypothetical protein ACK41C_20395 [Phenylobacterium sp.]|uniref:hypothetical protein n=1 Tax=Phenylobacterium sp. TaxID=1871053 RepID=UPI003918DE05
MTAAMESLNGLPAEDPRALHAEFAVEQVVHLGRQSVVALRLEPSVRQGPAAHPVPARSFARLSDEEVEAIDRAAVAFAADLPESGGLPLILPQSFRSMAGRKGRNALALAVGGAEAARKRLIVELLDIDRGTPAGRLTEVAGLINAVARGVLVRLPPARTSGPPPREARLQGLTLDGDDLPADDSEAASALLEFVESIRGLPGLRIAQGLPDEGYLAVAEVAGFTHAGLRGQAARAQAA